MIVRAERPSPSAMPPAGDQLDPPVVDPLRRDRLKRKLAEVGQEAPLDDPAVVDDGRRAPLAVVLDVAQPLARGLGKGDRAGEPRPARQVVTPGVGEDRVELALGALLGQVALGGPSPLRPHLAEHDLMLALGVAPLRHPSVARLPLPAEDVAADRRFSEDDRGGTHASKVGRSPDRKMCPEMCPQLGKNVPFGTQRTGRNSALQSRTGETRRRS